MRDDLAASWMNLGWQSCRVDEAGLVQAGQAKQSSNQSGDEFPYVRVANVQDDSLDLSELSSMPFPDPDRYVLRPGDVLIAESSGSRELVGRSAMYRGSPQPLMFQNHVLRFRVRDGIEPGYALLVFRAFQKSGVFAEVLAGASGISHLGLRRFGAFPFPLPPTSVQREIVDRARSIQTSLDIAVSAMEAAGNRLVTFMPDARDAAILGSAASTWSGKSTGESSWPLYPAEHVVEESFPIVYGILQPGPDVEGGVPYLRGGDIGDARIAIDQLLRTSQVISDRNARSLLREGDLVMNMVRNPRVAIVPPELDGAQMARGAARFRPRKELDSTFLLHWLTSGAGQRWLLAYMRGIDMPGLNLRDLRRMPVPLPPLSEQRRLADHLDELVVQTDTVTARLETALSEARDLERLLLASLAYGPLGGATSDQVLGSRVSIESIALKERLTLMTTEAPSTSKTPRRQAKKAISAGGTRGKAPAPATAERLSGDDIVSALAGLGRSATPEDLYRSLKLSENHVDAFYLELRTLIDNGDITENRPNDSDVVLRSVALR